MNPAVRILLVDPDPETRLPLLRIIKALPELELVQAFEDFDAARQALLDAHATLILVGLDKEPERALELTRALRSAEPAIMVVPASRRTDVDAVLRFLRVGATDFLPLPATPAQLQELLARLPRQAVATQPPRRSGQLMTLAGASGGVGCTTVAVNLARCLAADSGRSVALVDLDLLFGSVAACLNFRPETDIACVLQDASRLDLTLLRRAMPRLEGSNLHVLAAPEALEDSSRLEPEALQKTLALLTDAFDVVLVDTSKSLHVTDMIALERASEILLIVQGDPVNLYHSRRLLDLFGRLDRLDQRVRVVLNRAGSEADRISAGKVEAALGVPVFGRIPNVFRAIHAARTLGQPLGASGSGRRAYQAFEELASGVVRPAVGPEDSAGTRRKARLWSALTGRRAV